MCGRYNVTPSAEAFIEAFDIVAGMDNLPEQPRYNISPSTRRSETTVPAVRVNDAGARALVLPQWPLIPFWAKERTLKFSTANAKGETVAEKPAFRGAWRRGRRCLIPAHGYYEWQALPGQKTKQPYHICLPDGRLFAFGGVWDRWRDQAGGVIESCAIITTEPNDDLRAIHSRMPLIVYAADYDGWLRAPADDALDLIRPYRDGVFDAHPVSTYVNNPGNDDPRCLQKL